MEWMVSLGNFTQYVVYHIGVLKVEDEKTQQVLQTLQQSEPFKALLANSQALAPTLTIKAVTPDEAAKMGMGRAKLTYTTTLLGGFGGIEVYYRDNMDKAKTHSTLLMEFCKLRYLDEFLAVDKQALKGELTKEQYVDEMLRLEQIAGQEAQSIVQSLPQGTPLNFSEREQQVDGTLEEYRALCRRKGHAERYEASFDQLIS